jgi:RNA 2',3'-cyclic 3'-phosphodiesterase
LRASTVPEETGRLFVAVPVSPEAREACRLLIEEVRAGPGGNAARWIRTENLHLTVSFLGDTSLSMLATIAEAMRAAVSTRPPFPITLTGAGVFPVGHRPRALWLGIDHGAAELTALARALDAPLAGIGWPPEGRPLRPHLTVARIDAAPASSGTAVASALIRAVTTWRMTFPADRIVLYRSHLGGGPPRYEPIAEAVLGDSQPRGVTPTTGVTPRG